MARKVSQSDPALAIEFWLSGFYTHRSQLFAPFKGIGVNVVSFHDPVIDGANMEDTDLFEWQRRPAFSIFCPVALGDTEVVKQFYYMRNFEGAVIDFIDTTTRLATFDTQTINTIIDKTTINQGYVSPVGDMVYFSDGASADMQKWDSNAPLSLINPSSWGLAAPTLTPSIFNRGCWLPFTNFVLNNAIPDPNGNVEVVTATFGGSGISGANQPLWPTTTASTINDGSIQWTNMGPLENWLPLTNYPVPVVVLDTNGNLQLATSTPSTPAEWNAATAYVVGNTVFFGGNYWTATQGSTNVAPSPITSSTSGSTTTGFWVLSQNPVTTGAVAPVWNQTVGGATVDGSYTWTNLGPGQFVESFGTSYVVAYRTIYGHLTTASPQSINTGSIFGPTIATITAFSITNNVVTFIGANNFIPGNVFSVQGLSIGTFLNNQPFTIVAAGTSPTQFSAVFDFVDTPLTVDSGSTENLIATVQGVGTNSPLCNAQVAITGSQVTAGVVRVFAINSFVPGLQVTFTGLTVATFLNNLQFEIINVDPDGTWFEVFFLTALGIVPPDQAFATDTGTATFDAIEIYRLSDGGGIYLFTGAVANPTGTTVLPYDSGVNITGIGTDDGVPGSFPWTDSNNVTSTTLYATAFVPTPVGGGGGARFQAVQVAQNFIANQTVPSTVVSSFSAQVTGGNTIMLFVDTFQMTSWTVRDSQNNVYTQIDQRVSPNDHGIITTTVYRAVNVAQGPTTVTLSVVPQTGTAHQCYGGFAAVECSGLNGTLGPINGGYSPSGTTVNTGTVTTAGAAQTNCVIFSFGDFDLLTRSDLPATKPSGYTLLSSQVVFDAPAGDSFQQMALAYQVVSALGTYSPIWSTPANSKSVSQTVALELALFAPSDGLDAKSFQFSVPPSIGITGIEVDFESFFSGTSGFGIIDVQLLKGGVPVGTVMQVSPTNINQNFTLGGTGNLWGTTWQTSDFSSAAWGVRFIATQLTGGSDATFEIRNVRARLTGSTSTTGWVFNDFTTDANLNVLQIAPQNHLNDPPPGAPGSSVNQVVGTFTTYWQGRLWMIVGNYVYFSAGPDCTNGVPEEAWPPSNRFKFTGPVIALTRTADGVGLLVYLADRVAAILGGPETISFYATDALDNFGISSPNTLFRDGSTLGQFTTQKQYFDIINGIKAETGEKVADYLTENFDPAKSYVTMHRDGLDVGVFISNGVDQVLRYGSNIQAWSVPAFPVSGAGALRSIETSVGVTTLMLASPTGGITGSTALTVPTLGATAGMGSPWLNPSNITLGVDTDYATVTLTAIPTTVGFNNVVNGATVFATPPATAPLVTSVTVTVTNIFSGNTGLLQINVSDLSTSGAFAGVTASVVDSLGNVWLPATAPAITNSNNKYFQVFYVKFPNTIATGTTFTITTTFSNPSINMGLQFAGFMNVTGVGALNPSHAVLGAATSNAGTGVFSVGTINFTSAAFVVAGSYSNSNISAVPVGLSQPNFGSSGAGNSQVLIGLVTGSSFTDSWTTANNTPVSGVLFSFAASVASFPSYDGSVTGSGAAAAPFSVGPITPSGAGEWALFATAVADSTNTAVITPDPTWTVFGDSGFASIPSYGLFGQALPTAGSITANASSLPATGWCGAVVLFKLAAGLTVPTDLGSLANGGLTSFGSHTIGSGSTTAGNTLMFVVEAVQIVTGGITSMSITDTQENIWTQVAAVSNTTGGITGTQIYIWMAQNIKGGAITVTGVFNGTGNVKAQFATMQLSGLSLGAPVFSQNLQASAYGLNIPTSAVIRGVQLSVTGKQSNSGGFVNVTPLNAVQGAESDTATLTSGNTTVVFGGPTDLWGMPAWISPAAIDAASFGFQLSAEGSSTSGTTFSISEMKVTVFYQNPGNYIFARDLSSWGDNGQYGQNNGVPYSVCNIVVGSITLSQLGAPMFSLQHVVGYFDAVGTLNHGGPSRPDIWLRPNEIGDGGPGFVQLPEILQEPPTGQNIPSKTIQALRWPVNMVNSNSMSQFIHHLQVKIQFEPENAPNTIKALAFKQEQE